MAFLGSKVALVEAEHVPGGCGLAGLGLSAVLAWVGSTRRYSQAFSSAAFWHRAWISREERPKQPVGPWDCIGQMTVTPGPRDVGRAL